MSDRFKNQVAVVTGGSTGIGRAMAAGLLAEGARRVYITGRTAKNLHATAAALGEGVVAIVSDVGQLADLQAMKAAIEARGDRLDAVFANAGIAEYNRFGNTSEADHANTFDINVKGVFFTVQSLLPLLKDGSAVVLTASIVAHKGMESLSLYSASKAAVRSLARSWANELKGRRIRVNALSPGHTHTPIMENGLKWDAAQRDAFAAHAAQAVPLGHVAEPEAIASAALLSSRDQGECATSRRAGLQFSGLVRCRFMIQTRARTSSASTAESNGNPASSMRASRACAPGHTAAALLWSSTRLTVDLFVLAVYQLRQKRV
jgi:NAD(P)-dependent dehydrogenase (short-subunit alcohol dehydrogenase family)